MAVKLVYSNALAKPYSRAIIRCGDYSLKAG
jgi:hypothetical protein